MPTTSETTGSGPDEPTPAVPTLVDPTGPASGAAPATPPVLHLEGRPLETAEDVARYFGVSKGQLIHALYRAADSTRYHHFEIPKRTGGMRLISAPRGLVRQLQDRLNANLTRLYEAHPAAHGFIKTRSIVTNAANHTGRRWVLNIDLQDFFPTINFGRVRGLFMARPFGMGHAAATVCAQICTYRNGLPQGAPTSPVLSNFIATPLDRRLLRLARSHKLDYARYADDITFSTDLTVFPPAIALHEEKGGGVIAVKVGEELEKAISASGFTVNARKVRIQGRGVHQSVTGLCVNTRVNVERRRIRQIRAMIHAWEKFGLAAAGEEHFSKYRGIGPRGGPKDKGAAFRNIVYGHLSFVKMVRGADDPVFLNLCAKLIGLDPNPSRFVRQMVFGADDFEVFISHAREDKAEIARPILEACERLGIKAFLDEAHIGWGESFTVKINTALGAARTVLAIVSSHSVTKDWPLLEVNTALGLEVTGEKRVVTVMVGNPDLSKLPMLRGKNWLVWDGDAETVARAVQRAVLQRETARPGRGGRPASPAIEPAAGDNGLDGEALSETAGGRAGTRRSSTSVPSTVSPWAASPGPAASKPRRGWLSRLLGRRS